MSLLVRRCLNHAHLLEQLLISWQLDHDATLFVEDMGELIDECLNQGRLCRRAAESLRKRSMDIKETRSNLLAGEEVLRLSVDRTLQMIRKVDKLIDAPRLHGGAIQKTGEFRQTAKDLRELAKEIDGRVAFDPSMLKQSMADYQRGDYRLVEDMLHELQGDTAQDSEQRNWQFQPRPQPVNSAVDGAPH